MTQPHRPRSDKQPPMPHDTGGAAKWRKAAFSLSIGFTMLAFLVIGVLAYVPGMTTYQEGLILFAELGVGVMLVAGIAWMLAASLRKPSDH